MRLYRYLLDSKRGRRLHLDWTIRPKVGCCSLKWQVTPTVVKAEIWVRMILFCKLTKYRGSTAERLGVWAMLHVFPPDMLSVVSMLCPDTTGQLNIIRSPVCGLSLTVDCASLTDEYVQLDFSSLSTRGKNMLPQTTFLTNTNNPLLT